MKYQEKSGITYIFIVRNSFIVYNLKNNKYYYYCSSDFNQ